MHRVNATLGLVANCGVLMCNFPLPRASPRSQAEMTTTSPEVIPESDFSTRTNRQPPYAVILHNDDLNTMEFVIEVLQKVFAYPREQCVALMLEAHQTGRAIVWVGPLEVAELKAEQICSCGPDPRTRNRGAQPLGVTVEPLP